MLSVKDSLLLKIMNHKKYQVVVLDLVSHRGITLILFGKSVIQPVCLFDVYLFVTFSLKSYLLKKCFSDINLYKAEKSAG